MGNDFNMLGTITNRPERMISRMFHHVFILLGTACGLLLPSVIVCAEETEAATPPQIEPFELGDKPPLVDNKEAKADSARAVADALGWIARHPNGDGGWSIEF